MKICFWFLLTMYSQFSFVFFYLIESNLSIIAFAFLLVTIQMVGKHGFLSANEWPLLLVSFSKSI